MTERQLAKLDRKVDAIEHYETMIAWAKKQPASAVVFIHRMFDDIGMAWFASDCPYCQSFYADHHATGAHCRTDNGKCPLTTSGKRTYPSSPSWRCCGLRWQRLNGSATWGKWVRNAQDVLDYIKEKG